jgi:hypothetical protein
MSSSYKIEVNGSEKAVNSPATSQVNLVQPNGKAGDRRWSVFEKVLLVLVLIFFIGFIVFVALYASELSNDDDKSEKTAKGNH